MSKVPLVADDRASSFIPRPSMFRYEGIVGAFKRHGD